MRDQNKTLFSSIIVCITFAQYCRLRLCTDKLPVISSIFLSVLHWLTSLIMQDNNVGKFLYVVLWNNFISHINSFPVTLPVDVNVPLVREQDCHVWSFYYSSQNNTMSYCTLLPCYIALLAWHPTCSLGQKLQRVKLWQTMLPWHLLLCLFYMRISMSNVTLSVLCYRTRARVITFIPVFLWRVTYSVSSWLGKSEP